MRTTHTSHTERDNETDFDRNANYLSEAQEARIKTKTRIRHVYTEAPVCVRVNSVVPTVSLRMVFSVCPSFIFFDLFFSPKIV